MKDEEYCEGRCDEPQLRQEAFTDIAVKDILLEWSRRHWGVLPAADGGLSKPQRITPTTRHIERYAKDIHLRDSTVMPARESPYCRVLRETSEEDAVKLLGIEEAIAAFAPPAQPQMAGLTRKATIPTLDGIHYRPSTVIGIIANCLKLVVGVDIIFTKTRKEYPVSAWEIADLMGMAGHGEEVEFDVVLPLDSRVTPSFMRDASFALGIMERLLNDDNVLIATIDAREADVEEIIRLDEIRGAKDDDPGKYINEISQYRKINPERFADDSEVPLMRGWLYDSYSGPHIDRNVILTTGGKKMHRRADDKFWDTPEEAAPETDAIDDACGVFDRLFAGAGLNAADIALAVCGDTKPPPIPDDGVKDGHAGFIFSEKATFGDEQDGDEACGIGPLLPRLAIVGVRVAVVLSSDESERKREEEFIKRLNRKIDPINPETSEKRIRFGTSSAEISGQFSDLGNSRPARFYYLKTSREEPIDGIAGWADIVVSQILKTLGILYGIVDLGKIEEMIRASKLFARSA